MASMLRVARMCSARFSVRHQAVGYEHWHFCRNVFRLRSKLRDWKSVTLLAVLLAAASTLPTSAIASAVVGPASEWTQLLNNAELIGIAGQSAEQVQNQLTQIGQLAQQIQNQIQIYENMLQNTLQLPSHAWGQVESDLAQLRGLVNQGQGIAFSMGNLDDVLKQRFQSFAEFKTGLANGEDFSSSYQQWSDTNRDTIASTLRAAGLTSDQFSSEEATMAQLRSMSESSVGQNAGVAGGPSDRRPAGGADPETAGAGVAADGHDGHLVPV